MALVLGVTALMAPRSLTLTDDELVIGRFLWPAFHVPLANVTRVGQGPDSNRVGSVWRLAGVGGWFWSGGLFWARGTGKVRAWLTRLGPTVLLHRAQGLPILLSVDDLDGFLSALRAVKPT